MSDTYSSPPNTVARIFKRFGQKVSHKSIFLDTYFKAARGSEIDKMSETERRTEYGKGVCNASANGRNAGDAGMSRSEDPQGLPSFRWWNELMRPDGDRTRLTAQRWISTPRGLTVRQSKANHSTSAECTNTGEV